MRRAADSHRDAELTCKKSLLCRPDADVFGSGRLRCVVFVIPPESPVACLNTLDLDVTVPPFGMWMVMPQE